MHKLDITADDSEFGTNLTIKITIFYPFYHLFRPFHDFVQGFVHNSKYFFLICRILLKNRFNFAKRTSCSKNSNQSKASSKSIITEKINKIFKIQFLINLITFVRISFALIFNQLSPITPSPYYRHIKLKNNLI